MIRASETLRVELVKGMPEAEYHASDGLSQSRIKVMWNETMLHLKWKMDHPDNNVTAVMRLGSAIHDSVLLPDVFERNWLVTKPCEAELQSGKHKGEPCGATGRVLFDSKWWCLKHQPAECSEQFVDEQSTGVITRDDLATIHGVRESISNHKYAKALLQGDSEVSAFWVDETTGVQCKGRFDLVSNRLPVIVDLKTTRCAHPNSFARDIYNLGYFIQAAHYLNGAKALGLHHDRFTIVAVEKEPPFAVAVYEIDPIAIDAGQRILAPLMQQYAKCLETDEWPGYDSFSTIDLPRYGHYQIDEMMGG